MSIDQIDEKILKNLMVDARVSARQLALKMGMSTVTIISRIKKLEKNNFIIGYAARLDHQKLGYDITAMIEVKAEKGKMIEVENKIAKLENVCAVYDVTGTTDTIIIAKFKNRDALGKFVKELATIHNIVSTNTHIVLNEIKEDFRIL